MILFTDAHYGQQTASAAGVWCGEWDAAEPQGEQVVTLEISKVGDYQPGSFYLRELPLLLKLLEEVPPMDCVVVDGHAWLQTERPGLGEHLHRVSGIPVVGIAKSGFNNGVATEVMRGKSTRPLHVTASGLDVSEITARVAAMHGPHRIPTMLARADTLARAAAT